MQVILDPGDPRPVFQQIVDEIQRGIVTGILQPNDPLPAVRELARQLKVNPNTVQQAYRELDRAGSVYVRRGLGTFVAETSGPTAARRALIARQIASRFLREGFRHGLLASDLLAALEQIAPASAKATEQATSSRPATGQTGSLTAVPGRLGFDG